MNTLSFFSSNLNREVLVLTKLQAARSYVRQLERREHGMWFWLPSVQSPTESTPEGFIPEVGYNGIISFNPEHHTRLTTQEPDFTTAAQTLGVVLTETHPHFMEYMQWSRMRQLSASQRDIDLFTIGQDGSLIKIEYDSNRYPSFSTSLPYFTKKSGSSLTRGAWVTHDPDNFIPSSDGSTILVYKVVHPSNPKHRLYLSDIARIRQENLTVVAYQSFGDRAFSPEICNV